MTILSTLRKMVGVENSPTPAVVGGLSPFTSLPLKVKIKNLSAESEIIRQEEDKQAAFEKAASAKWASTHNAAYWELRHHRETVVRYEQRATLLAYGFLRGLSYSEIEPIRYSDPLWEKVEYMILAYARGMRTQDIKQNFERWKQEAGKPAVRGPRKPRIRPSKKTVDTAQKVA